MRLEMGMEARLQLQQKQILAPQIIQSIEILQLPAVNLLEYVEQQLLENEAIEIERPDFETRTETPPDPPSKDASESRDADLVQEFIPEDWETFKPRRVASGERDLKLEALQNTASRPASPQDMLADQLGVVAAPPRLRELARIVIYNLDDDGFLPPHRFVNAVLDSTDDNGSLLKPLKDVVASVDGIAAVKIPEPSSGATAEQIAEARESCARNVSEAQRVLSLVQRIRELPGGREMSREEILMTYPLLEVLEQAGGDWTLEEAEAALAVVQTLEPRGVAARSIVESLILQLELDDLLYVEKRCLLEHHLEDVKKNRLQNVARDMGLDVEDVVILIEELKGLDLRPASRLAPEVPMAVHPDVVIQENDEGDFQVDLVNSWLPPLTVSSVFVEMANSKRLDAKTRDQARRKVDSARWLIDAIAQRQSTLRRVSERIFHHQRDYLLHGDDALRPLKMQTVADALGIHVSTVSRAIADKWVQSPQGIRPLKFFFTGGTETAGGGVESRHSVKNRVKAVIDAEDTASPLSDDDVAAKLQEQGLEIARRTVTKYRKQLGIPSSRQRRKWT